MYTNDQLKALTESHKKIKRSRRKASFRKAKNRGLVEAVSEEDEEIHYYAEDLVRELSHAQNIVQRMANDFEEGDISRDEITAFFNKLSQALGHL